MTTTSTSSSEASGSSSPPPAPAPLPPTIIKCAVVGDAVTGKTALLETFLNKNYPENYSPTTAETYRWTVPDRNGMLLVDLIDCAGNEDFAKLRQSFYIGVTVFVLCYSISSPSSYENITKKWQQELHTHCPKAAIILVGTKLDLRDDQDTIDALEGKKLKPITKNQGNAKAKEINAYTYIEISTKTKKNLQAVFDEIPKAKQPSGFMSKLLSLVGADS